MVNTPCSRKSFLAFGICTLASGLVGCSEDPGTTPGVGGASGSGGKAAGGTGGSAGATGGGGSGGTTGGSGGTAGGSSGSSGSAGSSGSSGSGGTAGGSGGSSGSAGASGSGGSGGAGAMCTADLQALCLPDSGEPDGHTHLLIIPASAVNTGTTMMFETEADASQHTHEVELTAEDFTTLKAGGVVRKDTCGQGPHQFVISCVATPDPELPDCPP